MRRQDVHQYGPEDIRNKVQDADVRDTVRNARSKAHTREDGDDLDYAVDATKKCGLQGGEAKLGDYNLPLVRQRVRDVVQRGEQSEHPCLRISQSLNHPAAQTDRQSSLVVSVQN